MKPLSTSQMSEIDQEMIQLGVDVKMMMEHAGLEVARLVKRIGGQKVLVVCGHGNNGGDGLCAARHLLNWGFDVSVVLASPEAKFTENSRNQLQIIQKMECPFGWIDADVIVDALLGYNIDGNPRGNFKELIEKINSSESVVVSVDVPSGMADDIFEPHVEADYTIALSAPKKNYTGKLVIGYMGVPQFIFDKVRKQE